MVAGGAGPVLYWTDRKGDSVNKLFMALFMLGLIIALMVGLWYLAAFLTHTIGPENWRWLSDVDRVRLIGEVRGFSGAMIAVALVLARVHLQRKKGKDEEE